MSVYLSLVGGAIVVAHRTSEAQVMRHEDGHDMTADSRGRMDGHDAIADLMTAVGLVGLGEQV